VASKDEIDLTAPFLAINKAPKGGLVSTTVKVSNRVILDLKVMREGTFQLADFLAKAAAAELVEHTGPIKDVTRQRRRRAQRTPQPGRYPGGFSPNPGGTFGIDSGYLLSEFKAAKTGGESAAVTVPKNREKAAYVVRGGRVLDPATSEHKAVRTKGLKKLLEKMVKVKPASRR